MKVHYVKKDPKRVSFVVSGVDFTTANAIRRAIMTYVPSMAVEKMTLYDNTSPLYEEMIAQRIGLVPLTTDLKTYVVPAECKCGGEGCGRCQVAMILEKSGPCTVYSGDIKSRDPKVKPIFDKIPITKMRDGQSLKMEMVASLGYMTQHAKYQGALAAYKQVKDDEFEFFVESYNNIPAQEMVELAVDSLEKRADELEDAFMHPGRRAERLKRAEEKKAREKAAREAEKAKGEEKKAKEAEKVAKEAEKKEEKAEKPKKVKKAKKASKKK